MNRICSKPNFKILAQAALLHSSVLQFRGSLIQSQNIEYRMLNFEVVFQSFLIFFIGSASQRFNIGLSELRFLVWYSIFLYWNTLSKNRSGSQMIRINLDNHPNQCNPGSDHSRSAIPPIVWTGITLINGWAGFVRSPTSTFEILRFDTSRVVPLNNKK